MIFINFIKLFMFTIIGIFILPILLLLLGISYIGYFLVSKFEIFKKFRKYYCQPPFNWHSPNIETIRNVGYDTISKCKWCGHIGYYNYKMGWID